MEKDYQALRTKAVRLRKRGLSYNEIKIKINVSKSTLSLWLKNIPLKQEHRQRLYTKQVRILNLGPRSQQERRAREVAEIIEQAKREIVPPVSLQAYRLTGAALYWAEGSKGRMLQLTNSDPSFILFWVKWVEKIFQIGAKSLKARLNIYPQQNESDIKKFWSDLTGIPLANFGKSYVKPKSKNYKRNNLYYGTIRIEAPKSTNLKHRVFGWVKAVLQDLEPRLKLVQRKWEKLQQTDRPVNL